MKCQDCKKFLVCFAEKKNWYINLYGMGKHINDKVVAKMHPHENCGFESKSK